VNCADGASDSAILCVHRDCKFKHASAKAGLYGLHPTMSPKAIFINGVGKSKYILSRIYTGKQLDKYVYFGNEPNP
jgi:hypothetical protein